MKILISVILIMITFSSYSQKLDCAKFKNGTFFYPQIPDYGYSIRKNDTQKSYVKAKDMWVTWEVKWTDDCSFELIFKEADKNDGTYNSGDRISVTIISTENDCYKFISVFYNAKNPDGKKIPAGEMCIKQN